MSRQRALPFRGILANHALNGRQGRTFACAATLDYAVVKKEPERLLPCVTPRIGVTEAYRAADFGGSLISMHATRKRWPAGSGPTDA